MPSSCRFLQGPSFRSGFRRSCLGGSTFSSSPSSPPRLRRQRPTRRSRGGRWEGSRGRDAQGGALCSLSGREGTPSSSSADRSHGSCFRGRGHNPRAQIECKKQCTGGGRSEIYAAARGDGNSDETQPAEGGGGKIQPREEEGGDGAFK